MNKLALLIFLGATTLGCVDTLSETDRPCPCSEGFVCCPSSSTCIAEGSSCTGTGSGGGAGAGGAAGGSGASATGGTAGTDPDAGPIDFVCEGLAGLRNGTIRVSYRGSEAASVTAGGETVLRYTLSGVLDPPDDVFLRADLHGSWKARFRNGDGSAPLHIHLGTTETQHEFQLVLDAPDLTGKYDKAETLMYVMASSCHDTKRSHVMLARRLAVGEAPPPSAADLEITLKNTGATYNGNGSVSGFYWQTGTGLAMNFDIHNRTSSSVEVVPELVTEPPAKDLPFQIHAPSASSLVIAGGETATHGYLFLDTHYPFSFTVRARDASTNQVLDEVHARVF